MRAMLESEVIGVFDDVLPGETLERLGRWIKHDAPLELANVSDFGKIWDVADGHPLRSSTMVIQVERGESGELQPARAGVPVLDGTQQMYPYPSETPVDAVIDLLLAQGDQFKRWLGEPVTDWKTLSATGYAYPYGTGFQWHGDGNYYTGAFVLYVHPVWKPRWDGEFLVTRPPFDEENWDGVGTFVTARPNRLVVIRGGTPHKVQRVSPLAGENFRCSVGGFFDRRALAEVVGG